MLKSSKNANRMLTKVATFSFWLFVQTSSMKIELKQLASNSFSEIPNRDNLL